MTLFLLVLVILSLAVSILLYLKLDRLKEDLAQDQEDYADNLSEQLTYQLDAVNKDQQLRLAQELNRLQQDMMIQLTDVREVLHQTLSDNRETSDQRLAHMQSQLSHSLEKIQESNEKRMEDMRLTVEEKLDQTLHTRLQTSFETVSKQLESVNQGLGEMRHVAKDVGTLNKVLSNTKTRGILGELQLGQIIEDIMTPQQYEREFATVPGSSERVEYAIKLPGASQEEAVYLPIDSKFPLEDYYRLEDAYEAGDKELIDAYRKALLASIKRFAKDIQKKYLKPPATTNFGILFLPTEGLYSEVVRQAAFFDSLRREENIVVAGPTTLSALLNSLSVGFKTLNIQQNADDISKVLGNVKTEFEKYQGLLLKAQKQLNTANSTLDSLVNTRTKAIIRALDKAENYQGNEKLLELTFDEDLDGS
ncbi:DNA recombination protein RmuC [Streptococcus caprae]|uniref:DNA recombination protein RmuC n=1 Tax=Streptococcus caprae TaxID=1640501 RepID=A0ABV8CTX6_9STRE